MRSFPPSKHGFTFTPQGGFAVPAIDPSALPKLGAGYRPLRDPTALQAVLQQEGAWILSHLEDDVRPESATDPRWLDDDIISSELDDLWRTPGRRGTVEVWADELAVLEARDVPPGVRISLEDCDQGLLRRGVGDWPFVVDTNLGYESECWGRSLDLWAYMSIVRAIVETRVARDGDIRILRDAVDHAPKAATLLVRVYLRESRADAAFAAAQQVFTALWAAADAADGIARQAFEKVMREVSR